MWTAAPDRAFDENAVPSFKHPEVHDWRPEPKRRTEKTPPATSKQTSHSHEAVLSHDTPVTKLCAPDGMSAADEHLRSVVSNVLH
jgi:hypothetical protein